MTKIEAKPAIASVNELFSKSPDGLREIVRAVMQEMLEAEMTDALGAGKGERTAARLGYRSGYYARTLITRVGKLELRVPQDRDGRFSTELFERYQRSEQALVATLAEMYVQGVSTRKVKAITEELCGHAFSASSISAINKRLDESLRAFAERPLGEPFPYLILDARYEKVREGGVVASQAVLIAIGVDWKGAARSLRSRWPIAKAAHPGRTSSSACASEACMGSSSSLPTIMRGFARRFARSWPRQPSRDATSTFCATPSTICRARPTMIVCRSCAGCTTGARPRRPAAIFPAWIAKWGARYQKLVAWVEETIEETLTFYRLPRQHHKHLKSTNLLERLNEEIRRRTYVVRIFPNSDACRRLIRALAVETHENWLEAHRYLNMNDLKEHKKTQFSQAA
jgi:putative transposase